MSSSVRTGQGHAIVLVSWHLDLNVKGVAVDEAPCKAFFLAKLCKVLLVRCKSPRLLLLV